jgi:hypothetical protein
MGEIVGKGMRGKESGGRGGITLGAFTSQVEVIEIVVCRAII